MSCPVFWRKKKKTNTDNFYNSCIPLVIISLALETKLLQCEQILEGERKYFEFYDPPIVEFFCPLAFPTTPKVRKQKDDTVQCK